MVPSVVKRKSSIRGGSRLLIDSMFCRAVGRCVSDLVSAATALLEASMKTCLCGRGSLGGQIGLVHSRMFSRRCSQYVSSSTTSRGMSIVRAMSHPFFPLTSEQMKVYRWRKCKFTSEPSATSSHI